jgi:hypothetical protein
MTMHQITNEDLTPQFLFALNFIECGASADGGKAGNKLVRKGREFKNMHGFDSHALCGTSDIIFPTQ